MAIQPPLKINNQLGIPILAIMPLKARSHNPSHGIDFIPSPV